ncbi:MAG: response regulator [Cyanobacteria bacterium J06598_3]
MVVNDNVTNREILSAHLQRRGYTVVKVDSPSATLDVLNQFSIDLVLLDIMVPESGNFNLLQQIRKTHRKTDLAVILITINDSDEAVVKAFDAGANDYVSKPINLAIVMARIKSQLETLQANRQLRSDLQAAPTPPSVSTSLPAAPPPAATPPVITPPVITPPVTAPPVTAQVSTTPQLATSTSPTLAEASTQSSQVLQTNDPAPVAGKALSNASSEHSNPTQAPSTRATGTFAFSYKPYFLGHTFSKTPFSQIKLAQRPSELEAVPKSPPKSPPESPLCFVETFFLNNTNEASLNKLRTLLELEKSRLASISQNNCILSLVDFFENDQVFGWYQNYVEGRLFAEELSTGQIFSVQKVLKTIKALLEMLLPFHTRKIVHASLQPQHLWRCSEDEELRLLSLGLSRRLLNHLREQAASDHTATHLPAFNHEHDYMPVEQRIGQAVLSSDLYSVGLIALQMLTGKPLSVLTNSLIASESSLEQLALVPADIQPLLAKMVAQDPQSRYPSALAALRGLNQLVSVRSQ